MGTYNKGILGAFSGKVGPVVGASWRGKDVMRSLPKKSNRLPTANQLEQRNKFALVTSFLTPINAIIKRYFGNNTGTQTRRNAAMSYLIKDALVFNDPDWEWDFSKILIARGELQALDGGAITAGAGQSIAMTWTDNSMEGNASPTDKLVVVVYEESAKNTWYSVNLAPRNAGSAILDLPAYTTGLTVHVWATFASADDVMAATSQYLGTVVIA
jgi:hypothetical protein